jgi:potassium channel subfamily K
MSPDELKLFKRVPTNEFERRQQEFNLMREIQRRATVRRRWADLAFSTSCWLLLWLVGALIFMRFEKPYQDWSYFESFYFCFVSLATIGYGDKTPVSNGGRSFFVFWSLLALPTMTVLISNAGDTVVKFIKDATLRVGSVTILPGEDGFADDVKHLLHQASWGRIFPNHSKKHKVPSPRRSFINDLENGSDTSIAPNSNSFDNNCPTEADPACPSRHQQRALSSCLASIRNPHADLPTGPAFHYLLACEIQAVASHLHEGKPRRYTFEEWAWYLKLIGEDERNPELHRGPKAKEVRLYPEGETRSKRQRRRRRRRQHRHMEGEGVGRQRAGSLDHSEEEGEAHKWSWVGTRNPLMGGKEESEWIMERLTERLKEAIAEDMEKW